MPLNLIKMLIITPLFNNNNLSFIHHQILSINNFHQVLISNHPNILELLLSK